MTQIDDADPRRIDLSPTRQARTSTGARATSGLARELSELSRELQAEPDPVAMRYRITAAAVHQIPGAAFAGITLVSREGVVTEAATDDVVAAIDRGQYDLNEGPCLDSVRRQATVRSDDIEQDARWPRFGRFASGLGVRSMLSAQLFVQGDRLGALNLYGRDIEAFDDDDESMLILLASHAAIAMAADRARANLRTALDVRDLVGQAKGVLMERFGIGSSQAFDLLAASSQATNRKLTEVAQALLSTGALPVPQR